MEKLDKIKSRIKALLAKNIDNGATKSETESALVKANQLMLEYFISEHDLKDVEVEKCILKSVSRIKSKYDLNCFLYSLGKLFDCQHYYNINEVSFFGFEQDVELCCYFYNLIIRACLKEKVFYQTTESYITHKDIYGAKKLTSSFIRGFLLEVSFKMETIYKERERNIPQSYSVAVINKKEKVLNEFKNLGVLVKTKVTYNCSVERTAFEEGKTKGREINITQGIKDIDQQINYIN